MFPKRFPYHSFSDGVTYLTAFYQPFKYQKACFVPLSRGTASFARCLLLSAAAVVLVKRLNPLGYPPHERGV